MGQEATERAFVRSNDEGSARAGATGGTGARGTGVEGGKGADPHVCPIAPVLELFGSQWKHQILWHLQQQPLRFNELRRHLPGITPRTLTRQLRDLERDGLVNRTAYSEIPPRVVYSATELATSLEPVFRALNSWGHAHLEKVEQARERYGS